MVSGKLLAFMKIEKNTWYILILVGRKLTISHQLKEEQRLRRKFIKLESVSYDM